MILLCRRESIEPLDAVVSQESEKVMNCTIKDLRGDTVELADSTRVAMPLLEWGSPVCWPTGTDSFIHRDFVVRGVYYPQLVRLYQYIDKVSLIVCD